MIPCKIFEYMSTGNKIISFTHSEMDSSLPYMKKYPLALIIQEDDFLNDKNIELILDFILNENSCPDSEMLEKIFIKNTPKFFVESIERL